MATAVTQIATIPVSQDTSSNQNANPAPTMLKVGSPFDNNARHQPADDSNSSQTPAAVFDISPEAALHLLCLNIERLSAFFAQKPVGTEELHAHGSTPLAYGTPAENELRVNTVGLHIKELDDPIDPTRMTEEAIQMAILAKKFLSKKVLSYVYGGLSRS
ncbi:Cyclin-dependent protein kinase complex component, putative [Penicillium digitatum]|uniref:Cyclin-dependent protein kinase complex component, putative n=1 Tax=Penicillium digitatum TaxID=36651 RepID=A0A7T7BHJ6_PENDI|nr:Cyclin-dependent protein kinase complex component, putative [Penicillium digitatum]